MRVVADLELCDGNALCEKAAPQVFQVGPDDHVVVLLDAPPDSMADRVRAAVRLCPKGALSVE
jgi:ferredoxin